MAKDLRLKCPDCKSHSSIDITAHVDVRLKQYSMDGEDFGTDADASQSGDHEWDEEHPAHCAECGWKGKVGMLLRGGRYNHDHIGVGECLVCRHAGRDCVGGKRPPRKQAA